MYPLLVKDGLAVPTWSLCLIFYILSHLLLPHFQYKNDSKPQWIKQLVSLKRCLVSFYSSLLSVLCFHGNPPLSVCALSCSDSTQEITGLISCSNIRTKLCTFLSVSCLVYITTVRYTVCYLSQVQ